jgi:hypothetical protein
MSATDRYLDTGTLVFSLEQTRNHLQRVIQRVHCEEASIDALSPRLPNTRQAVPGTGEPVPDRRDGRPGHG